MTTLVVGCGYLGRRVAALLVARGERVIGTTRNLAKAEELVRVGVEPWILDVLDRVTGGFAFFNGRFGPGHPPP